MIGNDYERFVKYLDTHTVLKEEDVVRMLIPSGKTVTMPLAASCKGSQQVKFIVNDTTSSGNVTLALPSPDTSVGNLTLTAGRGCFAISDGVGEWTFIGPSGAGGAGSVVESDFSFTDITTANATSSAHGLMPKLTPGIATASQPVTLGATKNLDTLALDALTGNDASFGITGLGSTQGGDVVVTGGTSSTTGNAGGLVSMVGGAPGATGIGGAVSIIGGASGSSGARNGGAVSVIGGAGDAASTGVGGVATLKGGAGGGGATGNGGAVVVIGGASAATNGVGGAVGITGGLGTGSQAGGAVNITSGAAGATGVAGAINIAVGGATAGAGSSITITGGNGAGGTAAGGNVNVVPGTAVSTGVPGEFQVNGGSGILNHGVTFTATDATRAIFICTRAMRLKAASSVFTTASSSGTWTVEKLTGTTAPGSGTALLTGAINLSGTANTVANGTLIATVASLTFAAGDRLGIVIAGTMTNLVGGIGTVTLAPV